MNKRTFTATHQMVAAQEMANELYYRTHEYLEQYASPEGYFMTAQEVNDFVAWLKEASNAPPSA